MIYLDHASTTPLHPQVKESYHKLIDESFANADSIYDLGFKVKNQLEKSRQVIADLFAVNTRDLIFTSGASEANALAIKGYALANRSKGNHLITSAIEHASVLNAFYQLRDDFGFELDIVDVDQQGVINLEQFRQKLKSDTLLVSIMAINNEIGSIQPIEQLSKIIRSSSKAIFHVDIVAAIAKMDIDFSLFDMASLSAHKLGGIKGSGLLYRKQHLELLPLITGGQQENGVRPGTINAHPQILLAKTIRLALLNHHQHYDRIRQMKNKLVDAIQLIDGAIIHAQNSSSDYIVSFSTMRVPSEIMMNGLVDKGIYVSARSTCHSRDEKTSHVLKAIGASHQAQESVIRISLGYENTVEEIDQVIEVIRELVKNVKSKS